MLSKSLLEPSWADLGVVGRPSWAHKKVCSYWKIYYGSKIHVFDKDKLSRCVLDRTWPNLVAQNAKHDPMMPLLNDPKSSNNRCQQMIESLIEKKAVRGQRADAVPVPSRRVPGGMCTPCPYCKTPCKPQNPSKLHSCKLSCHSTRLGAHKGRAVFNRFAHSVRPRSWCCLFR